MKRVRKGSVVRWYGRTLGLTVFVGRVTSRKGDVLTVERGEFVHTVSVWELLP